MRAIRGVYTQDVCQWSNIDLEFITGIEDRAGNPSTHKQQLESLGATDTGIIPLVAKNGALNYLRELTPREKVYIPRNTKIQIASTSDDDDEPEENGQNGGPSSATPVAAGSRSDESPVAAPECRG